MTLRLDLYNYELVNPYRQGSASKEAMSPRLAEPVRVAPLELHGAIDPGLETFDLTVQEVVENSLRGSTECGACVCVCVCARVSGGQNAQML
jgi:hypothetical protein